MNSRQIQELADNLQALLDSVPAGGDGTFTPHSSRKLRETLANISADLERRIADLDPAKQPEAFFDPRDPRLFGIFAAVAMIGQARVPLDSIASMKFYGSGVYAIYYTGPYTLYQRISGKEHPIYVGKADPRDENAKSATEQGTALCSRLGEHRKNILKANTTLDINDFECRYLAVASGWQGAAEGALISLFRPIWNNETGIVYGFGKHGDSATTRANRRSPWDVLHPGRAWAGHGSLVDAKSRPEIDAELDAHFREHPVVPDLAHVLQSLLSQIKT